MERTKDKFSRWAGRWAGSWNACARFHKLTITCVELDFK